MRYLLIVGLILTIMTLGAVSASENVTDDGLAAEIEVDDSISEVDDSAAEILEESEGDVLGDYYNDGIVIQPKRMAVTDNLSAGVDVIDIDIYNDKYVGKEFRIYVNDNLAYNFTFDRTYDTKNIYNSLVGIQDYGEYKIDVWLEDTFLTTGDVPVLPYSFDVFIYDMYDTGRIEYQSLLDYRIELPSDATGTATISVNGKSYTVYVAGGIGRLFVSTDGWNLGNNTVTVTYNGDGKYTSLSRKFTLNVLPKVSFPNLVIFGSNTIIMSTSESQYITFVAPATASGLVQVKLMCSNGTNYMKNVTVSNGRGSYLLSDMPEGQYYLMINGKIGNVDFERNIQLMVMNNSDKFAVSLSPTQIVEGGVVDININAPFGNIVMIMVDDALMKILYVTSDSTRDAISGLAVGTHSVKIVGLDMNVGEFFSATYNVAVKAKPVPIVKKATKIVASKKTFKAKTKTKKYTIALKAGKAAVKKVKVTLKVKGKTYKATTNAKGKATFKITKLAKKGTFKAVIKFAGNTYYKASSKTVKITVK